MTRETISVLLTPPGRGAIATVLVAGPQAVEAVARSFRPASDRPLTAFSLGRIVFGQWGGERGEELVVCRRSEQVVEIHSHGGTAAVAAVIDSLAMAGCRNVDWQTWIRAQNESAIKSQALEALAQTTTERTAAILLDQYAGALQRDVEAVLSWLRAGDDRSIALAKRSLDELHARADVGRRLIEPCKIVLAGSPNVGKSSLINALAGFRRSIVYDQPGTTRDVVTTTTALDGWPVQLADTAGLRDADDELEAAGVERARATLAAADLQVLVYDATLPWSRADETLQAAWPKALIVYNKSDLSAAPSERRPPGLFTSATAMSGMEELLRCLAERVAPEVPPPGAAVPFHEAHYAAVAQARRRLAAGDSPGASEALAAMV